MTTKRTTTRTYQRPVKSHATRSGRQGIGVAFGKALRYTAAIARFAFIWFGAYLGVAAILLIGWAFSN